MLGCYRYPVLPKASQDWLTVLHILREHPSVSSPLCSAQIHVSGTGLDPRRLKFKVLAGMCSHPEPWGRNPHKSPVYSW